MAFQNHTISTIILPSTSLREFGMLREPPYLKGKTGGPAGLGLWRPLFCGSADTSRAVPGANPDLPNIKSTVKEMADSEYTAPSLEDMRNALIGMAIESWRFSQVFNRLLLKLDAGEQKRYMNQFRWFTKRVDDALEQAGLRIVNVEGHPFDPGMAAAPLNAADFDAQDTLVVDQMLEPIIMGNEGVVRTGTVTLRKVEL